MLLPRRRNGLDSLLKEVRVFKVVAIAGPKPANTLRISCRFTFSCHMIMTSHANAKDPCGVESHTLRLGNALGATLHCNASGFGPRVRAINRKSELQPGGPPNSEPYHPNRWLNGVSILLQKSVLKAFWNPPSLMCYKTLPCPFSSLSFLPKLKEHFL